MDEDELAPEAAAGEETGTDLQEAAVQDGPQRRLSAGTPTA